MRVEGLADAWGIVVAWVAVLVGTAWMLAPLALGEDLYLHPVATALVGVGFASAAAIARYWANIERFGEDEGFTAEWYRPFRFLSIYWLGAYFRALLLLTFPTTLRDAVREAAPTLAALLLLLSAPAGFLLAVGPEFFSPAPPPADAAAQEVVAVLQSDPNSLDIAEFCSADKASGSLLWDMTRGLAASELGEDPVEVGRIEYLREKGAQLARVELVSPADPFYAATLTMKYTKNRWLPCGNLVEPSAS